MTRDPIAVEENGYVYTPSTVIMETVEVALGSERKETDFRTLSSSNLFTVGGNFTAGF